MVGPGAEDTTDRAEAVLAIIRAPPFHRPPLPTVVQDTTVVVARTAGRGEATMVASTETTENSARDQTTAERPACPLQTRARMTDTSAGRL